MYAICYKYSCFSILIYQFTICRFEYNFLFFNYIGEYDTYIPVDSL